MQRLGGGGEGRGGAVCRGWEVEVKVEQCAEAGCGGGAVCGGWVWRWK